MDLDHETLLADFQACTGIDDVSESLTHLEEANWNLLDAVNRVIPQESQIVTAALRSEPSDLSMPSLVGAGVPGTSRVVLAKDSADDTVSIQVFYYDSVLDLQLPARETVSMLRLVLHARTDLAPCMQELRLDGKLLDDTDMPLSALPSGHLLTLQQTSDTSALIPPPPSTTARTEDVSCLSSLPSTSEGAGVSGVSKVVSLAVADLRSGRQHSLSRSAGCTIGQVKTDVSALTGIESQRQVWTGWPKSSTDKTLLYECDIKGEHKLTVTDDTPPLPEPAVPEVVSDNSSAEYEDAAEIFADADDSMFITPQRPSRQPLVPDNNEDELAGVLNFCEQFESRYGPCHPPFYHGTLADVAEEACSKPLEQRLLLMIYLHHDQSVLANVFCSQLLCAESISSYLSANFVCWGWDVTFESNMNSFLERLATQFGSRTRDGLLMSMDRERLPMLVLLMRSRGSTELVSAVHANTSVDELMGTLIHAHDVFSQQMHVELRELRERQARESVKLEQDLAYQASLLADRAKEEMKQAELEEQKKQEEEELREKRRQENEKQQEEAVREAVRKSLECQIPAEPVDGSPSITTIRFRSPDGSMFSRRFLISEPLQTVLNYVTVRGFPTDQFKVISSWPRRDLTTSDVTSCLEELKLFPQETLMIQER